MVTSPLLTGSRRGHSSKQHAAAAMLAEQVDLQPDASASLDEEALALRGQSTAQPVSRDGRCALGSVACPWYLKLFPVHTQHVATLRSLMPCSATNIRRSNVQRPDAGMALPLRRVWRSSLSPRPSGALVTPLFCSPASLQLSCISPKLMFQQLMTVVALRCSHVSGMKIRFLTLIEELRRAGDEVRHSIRALFVLMLVPKFLVCNADFASWCRRCAWSCRRRCWW